MRSYLAIPFAAAVMAGAAVPPPAHDLAKEETIASRVSLPAARANVRELVAFGPRTGGTASGDRAAAAVAGRLRDLHLRVEIVDDPPMRTHEEISWEVSLGDRPLSSAWPYNFSPSIARTTARLEPDRGGGPEAAASVKGAAVLVEGEVTRASFARLIAQGAIALLTDAPRDPNRYVDWAPIGSLPDAGDAGPPIPVFGLSYHDGRLLRDALAAGDAPGPAKPPPRVTLDLSSKIGEGRPRTVIATLEGAGARRDEILIVCAHGDSDSGGPGADDNASGVASLIEVARALSTAAADGLLPPSRPAVRFIVWGAEYHSSQAYAAAKAAELSRLKAVINFDETGTGAERDAVYYEGNDVPWNRTLLRALESAAEDHAGRPGFPTSWTSNPALGGTDAYVFLPGSYRGLGLIRDQIPSTTVFSAAWGAPARMKQTPGWRSKGWPEGEDLFIDYSAYYHSSGDTPANTTDAEPWNMERCARLVTVAICRLMEEAAAVAP